MESDADAVSENGVGLSLSAGANQEDAQSIEQVVLPDLPVIDSHHHLWVRPGKHYLMDEFARDVNSGHNIVATVFVECGAMYRRSGPLSMRSIGEAEFVAGMAAMSDSGHYGAARICAAFIGAADLSGPDVDEVLDALGRASGGRFRGIRGAVPWDADATINPGGRPYSPRGLLLDGKFRAGVARVAARELVYDAWQYHPQLPELCQLADLFPNMPIVVNHCGGPLGKGSYTISGTFPVWRSMVMDLARRPNVFMKLGGLSPSRCGFGFERRRRPLQAEELTQVWKPYIETCIDAFGPERCMFESNFPPDAVAGSYRTIWNALKLSVSGYSRGELEQLFSGTAKRVYRI